MIFSCNVGLCHPKKKSSHSIQTHCGTWHMASSFLPLSRTTTTAICSSSSLLSHHFHATSRTSFSLYSSSHDLCALTKTIRCDFHSGNLLCQKSTLAKNCISTANAPHQKVLTPYPWCSTSHQVPKGPTPHLALLLTSIRDALPATYALLPGHLSENSHPKNSEDSYYRNRVLGTITISNN